MDSESNSPVEDNQDAASRRASKARERVRRRRERRGSTPTPSTPTRRVSRQLTPAGGFKLPDFRLPYVRQLALVALAVVFMIALIILVGLFKNDPAQAEPNAVWLSAEWTQTVHDDSDIQSLVEQLRDKKIGTVYAWVGWLRPDGLWGITPDQEGDFNEVETQVQAFSEQFNRLYPEAQLYGWLNIPVLPTADGSSPLASEELLGSVSAFSLRVSNRLNFDGVFLDVEPVFNNDNAYLTLLQRVRGTIGQDILLGASVPPDWTPLDVDVPTPSVIAPGTVWDMEYKQRVALLVDDLVVQAFNSYLTQPSDYVQWVAYQVQAYADAVDALQTTTNIVIGVPMFEENLPAHDVTVETLASAINGVQLGLRQAGDAAPIVTGVAIFREDNMTDDDWHTFDSQWLH